MFSARTTWHNANDKTIYAVLKSRLNREPTTEEICQEVSRILNEGRNDKIHNETSRGGSNRARKR